MHVRFGSKRRGAISLLEVIVALGVLSVGVYALGEALSGAGRGATRAEHALVARSLARARATEIAAAGSAALRAALAAETTGTAAASRLPAEGWNRFPDRADLGWALTAGTEGAPAGWARITVEVQAVRATGEAAESVPASATRLLPWGEAGS